MKVLITVDDAGSLGPLTKPFLFENPLAPAEMEIAQAVERCGLYADASLDWLFLMARINRRDKNGVLVPSGVSPDASWKPGEKEAQYCAEFDFNLAALIGKERKRDSGELLNEALALFRSLSVQAAAQAAVELRIDDAKVRRFVATFPDVSISLQAARKRPGKSRNPPRAMLDVQILHDGGSSSLVSEQRTKLREMLEDALRKAKLGVFDGSSSGEFHFEFGFLVRDVDAAIELMRAALLASGIPAARIGFEVTGSRE